jgi:hypothetical protein
MSKPRLLLVVVALLVVPSLAHAACLNKFVRRTEGPRQIMTLLTGKLTFQEADALAKAISAKQAPPLEWVDDGGKTIAKQLGDMKAVRPMPVACDNKTSGAVISVIFQSALPPAKKMRVKLDANTIVDFEEQ